MDKPRRRDRFKSLLRPVRTRRSYFTWALWGGTLFLILQFFVPLALDSIEAQVKPYEVCPPCNTPGALRWCPICPTNRTCPQCGREWNAPYHKIVSMPWIIVGYRYLFHWN